MLHLSEIGISLGNFDCPLAQNLFFFFFSGKENGLPRSTAVLKSLWKDLDVLIGQLK